MASLVVSPGYCGFPHGIKVTISDELSSKLNLLDQTPCSIDHLAAKSLRFQTEQLPFPNNMGSMIGRRTRGGANSYQAKCIGKPGGDSPTLTCQVLKQPSVLPGASESFLPLCDEIPHHARHFISQ